MSLFSLQRLLMIVGVANILCASFGLIFGLGHPHNPYGRTAFFGLMLFSVTQSILLVKIRRQQKISLSSERGIDGR
jgi:hypothetical protein